MNTLQNWINHLKAFTYLDILVNNTLNNLRKPDWRKCLQQGLVDMTQLQKFYMLQKLWLELHKRSSPNCSLNLAATTNQTQFFPIKGAFKSLCVQSIWISLGKDNPRLTWIFHAQLRMFPPLCNFSYYTVTWGDIDLDMMFFGKGRLQTEPFHHQSISNQFHK